MNPGTQQMSPNQAEALKEQMTGRVNADNFLPALLQFLQRADLKGAEVQAFGTVWNILQMVGQKELTIMHTDKLDEIQKMADEAEGAFAVLKKLEQASMTDDKLMGYLNKARLEALPKKNDPDKTIPG